jgi:hypothetical protein
VALKYIKIISFWDVSEMLIAIMMDAVRASETSVNLYQTERVNIPEVEVDRCLKYSAV